MDVDAIDAVMQRFPLWFYEQLRAQRFILPDEAVTFVVKRKSRKVGVGNYKISYHFIVEIAGTPVWHRAVCNSIFYSFAADIKQIQSSKSVAHLSDDQILLPAYYCDIATLHGNQGFATLYSQKKVEDPRAFLVCRVAFRNGGEVARREFSQGSDDPTGPKAIEHLVHGCFTVPTCYVANYVASVGVMVRVVFFHSLLLFLRDPVESNHKLICHVSRRSQNKCQGAQPRRVHRTPPFAPMAVEVAAVLPQTCRVGLRVCCRGMEESLGVCGRLHIPVSVAIWRVLSQVWDWRRLHVCM